MRVQTHEAQNLQVIHATPSQGLSLPGDGSRAPGCHGWESAPPVPNTAPPTTTARSPYVPAVKASVSSTTRGVWMEQRTRLFKHREENHSFHDTKG